MWVEGIYLFILPSLMYYLQVLTFLVDPGRDKLKAISFTSLSLSARAQFRMFKDNDMQMKVRPPVRLCLYKTEWPWPGERYPNVPR